MGEGRLTRMFLGGVTHLPPRDGLEMAQCHGKVQYSSPAEARNNIDKSRRSIRTGLRVYKCRFCGGYHVGKPRSGEGA